MRLHFAQYGSVIAPLGKLISVVHRVAGAFREWLRLSSVPFFHRLFGARTVHRSERL